MLQAKFLNGYPRQAFLYYGIIISYEKKSQHKIPQYAKIVQWNISNKYFIDSTII